METQDKQNTTTFTPTFCFWKREKVKRKSWEMTFKVKYVCNVDWILLQGIHYPRIHDIFEERPYLCVNLRVSTVNDLHSTSANIENLFLKKTKSFWLKDAPTTRHKKPTQVFHGTASVRSRKPWFLPKTRGSFPPRRGSPWSPASPSSGGDTHGKNSLKFLQNFVVIRPILDKDELHSKVWVYM